MNSCAKKLYNAIFYNVSFGLFGKKKMTTLFIVRVVILALLDLNNILIF